MFSFKKKKDSKTVHVANYLVILGLQQSGAPVHYPLSVLQIKKLMYLIEGISYIKLGYGMTEEKFFVSKSIYHLGISPVSSYRTYSTVEPHDILTSPIKHEYKEAIFKDKVEKLLPTSLLSEQEKEIIEGVWESFKRVDVWEIIEWMKEDSAYKKAKEEDLSFLRPEDIRDSFKAMHGLLVHRKNPL